MLPISAIYCIVYMSAGQGCNTLLASYLLLALQAVTETAVTRAFLPAPILVIPPVIMTILERFVKYCANWLQVFVVVMSRYCRSCIEVVIVHYNAHWCDES